MQATCPQLRAADRRRRRARVPDRAVQRQVPEVPGHRQVPRQAAPRRGAPPPAAPPAGRREPRPGAAGARGHAATQTMAQPAARAGARAAAARAQVLVALPDRALAGALTLPLRRIGYAAEALESPDDGAPAARAGPLRRRRHLTRRRRVRRGETLYAAHHPAGARRAPHASSWCWWATTSRPATARRRSRSWPTSSCTRATRPSVEPVLLTSIAERNRLYQAFLDTKKRLDSSPQ